MAKDQFDKSSKLRIDREELDQGKFVKTVSDEIATRHIEDTNIRVKRIDTFSPNLIFTGEARVDPADVSAAIWRIKQTKTIGTEVISEYAGVGLFDQIWEDRLTLFPYENTFSLSPNGVDQYANVPNAANIDFIDNTVFSISAWVKMGVTTDTKVFFTKGTAGATSNHTISFYLPSNERLSFIIRAGGAGDRLRVRAPVLAIDDGNWHNIAVTYDGSRLGAGVSMYYDGVLQALNIQNDTLTGPMDAGDDWKFFTQGNTNGSFFGGNMDEPALWDKVLTQLEVTEMYNNGVASNLLEHSAAANMISCWTFNDKGNFPIAKDRADANDATLFNMSTLNYDPDTP